MSSVKVTSTLKKPYSTYLEDQAIGSLNNGSVNYNPTPSVNYSPTSSGTVSNGSVPQPTISLSPESVSSAQNSTNIQAPTYVSALETTTTPATVQANTVTNLPNVNASEMTNVTYKDAVKTPENVTADGNTEVETETDEGVVTGDASSGFVESSGEESASGSNESSGSEVKEEAPKLSYTEWLDLQKTNIAQAYADALKAAQTQRDRAVHNAGGMYQQALSQYGANAAAMSAMGLTGSGYSNYLNSQALAQKQGAINAANSDYQSALSSANSSKMSAENEIAGLYAKYLQEEETQRRNAFNDIMENIGKYSADDIGRLGKANGLTDEQITELKTARAAYTPSVEDTGVDPYKVFTEIYNNIGAYSINDIDRLTRNAGLAADSQYVMDLKAARTDAVYNMFKGASYTLAELERYKDDLGGEKGAKYLELVADAKNPNDTVSSESFIDPESKLPMTATEAWSYIDGVEEAGAGTDVIDALKAEFNKVYGITQVEGIVFNNDGGLKERPGVEGNNISLTGDEDGKLGKYRVQYSGVKGDASVKYMARNLDANSVFMYQGILYVKNSDGECYGIEARGMSFNEDYNQLLARFKAKKQETDNPETEKQETEKS